MGRYNRFFTLILAHPLLLRLKDPQRLLQRGCVYHPSIPASSTSSKSGTPAMQIHAIIHSLWTRKGHPAPTSMGTFSSSPNFLSSSSSTSEAIGIGCMESKVSTIRTLNASSTNPPTNGLGAIYSSHSTTKSSSTSSITSTSSTGKRRASDNELLDQSLDSLSAKKLKSSLAVSSPLCSALFEYPDLEQPIRDATTAEIKSNSKQPSGKSITTIGENEEEEYDGEALEVDSSLTAVGKIASHRIQTDATTGTVKGTKEVPRGKQSEEELPSTIPPTAAMTGATDRAVGVFLPNGGDLLGLATSEVFKRNKTITASAATGDTKKDIFAGERLDEVVKAEVASEEVHGQDEQKEELATRDELGGGEFDESEAECSPGELKICDAFSSKPGAGDDSIRTALSSQESESVQLASSEMVVAGTTLRKKLLPLPATQSSKPCVASTISTGQDAVLIVEEEVMGIGLPSPGKSRPAKCSAANGCV
ncbi:unnamed protein product [Protopolystoma xenopodis]|uniref:Uncharacterized protein n=1 Tax=Protopolystoma xenopodis TaxID=117903 RepID=A0A448WL14_9PLAT|nr:unnamed protein product [Protopolystoma xenopodis]